ncbi:MAG: inositol monophosphatase family protein [Paracoccaceae bacterium]
MDGSAEHSLAERYEFACALARRVGQEALRFWTEQGVDGLGIQAKGLQDFVTEADKAAEHTIRSELDRMFPQDGFVGEETGGSPGLAGYWVVDPIDGTANYLRGLRHWGVSIAYVAEGKTQIGVVHDAPNDGLYHARLGNGAYRDEIPIKVSATRDPHSAMGILGASRRTPLGSYLNHIQALFDAGVEHRKIGSAAIGIVRVAEGVVDFYQEDHLNSWDALAAVLISQEAGGVAQVPAMDTFIADGGPVLCATPELAELLTKLLTPETGDT